MKEALRDAPIFLCGLAAAGLLAIGLSGALAFALGSVLGKAFVAGDRRQSATRRSAAWISSSIIPRLPTVSPRPALTTSMRS